jgi:hypothetical protein
MTADEKQLNEKFNTALKGLGSTTPPIPSLQYVSYLTTGKPVLKSPNYSFTLKDGSIYFGQGDKETKTAHGFGLYK